MAAEVRIGDGETSGRSRRSSWDYAATAHNPIKRKVCDEIVKRLREWRHEAVDRPGFEQSLHVHFQHLPVRYAMDVNPERAEDVLEHKRFLELARTNRSGSPIIHVRSIHFVRNGLDSTTSSVSESPSGNEDDVGSVNQSVSAPPSFTSFPSLEALAIEMMKNDKNRLGNSNGQHSALDDVPMHEVTFSTVDKPKLLSKLSSVFSELGLNIREAHVYSTDDGYSLDVFVVDGWPTEDTNELQQQLINTVVNSEKKNWTKDPGTVEIPNAERAADDVGFLNIPSDGNDDWEIDPSLLQYGNKVASGSFGDLFKGTYRGQDVAIKVLKPERLNEDLQKEFAQEVSIMRKVRHKNVVQFIGACTRPPNLCIVTEFMSGGSVYDYLHKKQGSFNLPNLLKVAIDVSKGMDFLHQCNIIHRDLKAANLLMDEHEVVKVADFGVARVQDQTGVMTAETGTYRWMAPEVIEHKAYDHKADVFSFGIVMWELLTGKLPYDLLTPLQAAVGVVQKGLRPTIPKNVHPKLAEILLHCWRQNPAERPEFSELTKVLQDFLKEVIVTDEAKEKKKGGFFSALKRKPSY